MVKVTCSFVDDILWPEYVELQKELVAQLDTLAEEIIAATIFRDTTDIQEIPGLPARD
jgi:arginine repressor